MKVCVLQPDYASSTVDYRHYDPPRDLAPLLPQHDVHHVFLDKRTVYKQLQQLSRSGFDIFVNLCEGYLDWDIPSIDVIYALEQLGLPYTGPPPSLYDPPKPLMKYVAYSAGVASPRYAHVTSHDDIHAVTDCGPSSLIFPLFVKPAHSGDSRGISDNSHVSTVDALHRQVEKILTEYPSALIEEYVAGREFTVLVAKTADGTIQAFQPVEYVFGDGPPFKTYALKTSALHASANRNVPEPALSASLRDAAIRIFRAFGGVGYARLDFRQDVRGTVYFLEINFTCSVFYPPESFGSADHILQADGIGADGFLQLIIAEGIARHRSRVPKTVVRSHAFDGFGTYALTSFNVGDVVFAGEERSATLVTMPHVHTQWNEQQQLQFRRYAWPISDVVYGLWSHDPSEWRPQNHSCNPNTAYRGLDVIARAPIAVGDELTLDYGQYTNQLSEPFECQCGSSHCRGRIVGTVGNSVTSRAEARTS